LSKSVQGPNHDGGRGLQVVDISSGNLQVQDLSTGRRTDAGVVNGGRQGEHREQRSIVQVHAVLLVCVASVILSGR